MNHSMRKQTIRFLNRFYTIGAVQAQKRLEAGNFGFRKKRNCTIRVAKIKALISFAFTASCEADLRLCFRISKYPLMKQLKMICADTLINSCCYDILSGNLCQNRLSKLLVYNEKNRILPLLKQRRGSASP